MLCRCATRVIGGVSLLEVLHCAHRSLCSSPPIEHSPTSPNHELTTSTLEVISLTIFGCRKSLKSGSQSAPRKPPLRFGFSSHIGALTAHSAFAKSLFRDLLRRAVGGCCHRDKGKFSPFKPLCKSAVSQPIKWRIFLRKNRPTAESKRSLTLTLRNSHDNSVPNSLITSNITHRQIGKSRI